MSNSAQDDAFAKFARQALLASPDQIEAARRGQEEALREGKILSLSDALLQKGVITPVQRDAVIKKIQAAREPVNMLGHYKILKKLGEGGMGAVYLAEDLNAQRQVAVKVLPRQHAKDEDALRRFKREAEAAIRLSHPNLVQAYSSGEDKGHPYYVMEYCEGEPLDKRVKREQVLPWEQALDITVAVARGLQYAHERGFVHRDIKPSNIIFTKEGIPKILDLGLSKNIADLEQSFRTQTGVTVGTPHYISPEQAKGDRTIDGRADLYSLGATLYHLVTGQVPFPGSTVFEIIAKQLNAKLPNPQELRPGIPDGVVHVIRKLMTKLPADRYQECAELLIDLERVREGKPPASSAPEEGLSTVEWRAGGVTLAASAAAPSLPGPLSPRLRKQAYAIGGGVAALLLSLVLVLVLRGKPEPAQGRPREDDPWKHAVNLLALVDPVRDSVRGSWKREGDSLLSDGTVHPIIQFPYEAPEEYDFRIEFTRTSGKDTILQIANQKGRRFTWEMGVFKDTAFSFFIIGQPAMKNPTTIPRENCLENGRRYVSVVEVRKDGFRAFLDGNLISQWKTDYSDVIPHTFWRLNNDRYLGLAVAECAATFHRAEIREVTGRGRVFDRNLVVGPFNEVIVQGTSTAPFAQDSGDSGLVSFEASSFHRKVKRGHDWEQVATDLGTPAIQALPMDGTLFANEGPQTAARSPQLDYRVSFSRRGTHYVWVRGRSSWAPEGSIYVGLDGAMPMSGSIVRLSSTGAWGWSTQRVSSARATLEVPDMGVRTVNVWMRKDGVIIERIVLTTDPSFQPQGVDPASWVGASPMGPGKTPRVRPSAEAAPMSGGLNGAYYTNTGLSGDPVQLRVDPGVNFDWGFGRPSPRVGPQNFGVRWSGWIEAPATESFTLYTVTDDGARLWVDNRLLVDQWVLQGPEEYSGSIDLKAGERYEIVLEYCQAAGGASARLLWSSASTPKGVIPFRLLYYDPAKQ